MFGDASTIYVTTGFFTPTFPLSSTCIITMSSNSALLRELRRKAVAQREVGDMFMFGLLFDIVSC